MCYDLRLFVMSDEKRRGSHESIQIPPNITTPVRDPCARPETMMALSTLKAVRGRTPAPRHTNIVTSLILVMLLELRESSAMLMEHTIRWRTNEASR